MINTKRIEDAYEIAKDIFLEIGVDTDTALERFEQISLSLPCWQGDDITGFENSGIQLGGSGLQVTGHFPGKPRTADELRMDLEKAFSLIPGHHRLNLHSMYGEFGSKWVDRNEMEPAHFDGWMNWARKKNLKLDFNATCFSHPKAASGFTLSSKDREIRTFWIEHVKRCREISAYIGQELKSPCIHNLWIPDGMKDIPVDRWTHRSLLKESLDEIFSVDYSPEEMKDSLESKLFGIGSESCVIGSHEFYFGYALYKEKMLCLDVGHFHPTESLADKISSILLFFKEVLLHLSRGVRWDSDHVVILDDEIKSIAEEVVRSNALDKTHIALDFFDASMNRVGAWVIGARATLKSYLSALLQPLENLRTFEEDGDLFTKLALLEEAKTFPIGAVWNYYCLRKDVPPTNLWMQEIKRYEFEVLNKRDGLK
ncbi:MAG: L-rhamnose isomerase [Candidatus Aminicenantes bacterium]|nr:L-rhamnose isomerase [Candidatus Aminicenantes bacterium]MDH5742947.1 L-rhamnose isomerase [Candidatus Aminicenantes bacterium]